MTYHPKTIRGLAITQIVIGGACIVLGIGIFFIYTSWSIRYIQEGSFGLWAGAWFLATGLLGFFGSRDRQSPNKCILGIFLGFAITACVMSGIILICYAVALSYISRYNRGYYYSYYGRSFGGATAFCVIFLLISIVEFSISLASSIYCCNAVCTNGQTMPNQQVVYVQPGMGQVPGGVVMIAPGTTGAVMQPVQGQGQYMVQQPVQPGYWTVAQSGVTTSYAPVNQSQTAGYAAGGVSQVQVQVPSQPNQQPKDAPPNYEV